MLLLKSTRQCPPGGFIYRQAQTGWELSSWDFEELCMEVQKHRQANPKFGLTTNIDSIRLEVNQTNAARVAAIPGTESYLIQEGGMAPADPKTQAFRSLGAKLQGVAEGVTKIASGAGLLIDWIKDGAKSVPQEKATARAFICTNRGLDEKGKVKMCPKNSPEALGSFFTKAASELIRKQIEQRKELTLSTPYDAQLGVCSACLCPLKLKVHPELKYILEHTPAETIAQLDPGCWITNEK